MSEGTDNQTRNRALKFSNLDPKGLQSGDGNYMVSRRSKARFGILPQVSAIPLNFFVS